jgi:hypothetical protein
MIESVSVGRERIDESRARWTALRSDDQIDVGNFIAVSN